jgi:hypothetical protein
LRGAPRTRSITADAVGIPGFHSACLPATFPPERHLCNFPEGQLMPMNKPHLEFTRVDMTEGWASLPGYPAGIKQKILASDLDENCKMGSRTRLLKFDPGVYTTAPFVHDHWEEVYLITGDLIVGNDAQGWGGEAFAAPTYACRPPGVYHGPFKSEQGCMLFEIHYYDERRK